ncbi:hypothetical protein L208DRAFT_1400523, partial [Tricholoma matsutake]
MLNAIAFLIVYEIQSHALNWCMFSYTRSSGKILMLHFHQDAISPFFLKTSCYLHRLNARSPPAKPFYAGITISVENNQSSDQVFNSSMRDPVAN